MMVQLPAPEVHDPPEAEGTRKPMSVIRVIKLWDFRRGPKAPIFDCAFQDCHSRRLSGTPFS